jgi:hypothetical protein
MSDEQNKNKELAKKLVDINLEDRRQLQYCALKQWDAGYLTGIEAIEEILALEKFIRIDVDTLRRARNGQVHKPQDQKGGPTNRR